MTAQSRIVGTGVDRQDAGLKVQGRARYAAEFAPSGMVHAVLVNSTIASGEITGFDLEAARAMPGVIEIITPDNAEPLHSPPKIQFAIGAPLLQNKKVAFNGQHIAIVVATTLQQAQAAAARVRVDYKASPAVTDMMDALDKAYTPKAKLNGKYEQDTATGDVEAAMRAAAVHHEATYTTPSEHHNPMEPHATVAQWDNDKLTVWTATQGIGGARKTLAAFFGIAEEQVIVICPFVGGGFGSKGNTWPPATLAAMAAWQVRRPVKLEITREQMFTANGYRPRSLQRLRLGATADGKLTAVSHEGFTQMSMPSLGEFTEPVAMATRMLYACPSISTKHRIVPTNHALPTYMRAPGEASGMFALESAMDELAVALKMDPIALRLANHADRDASTGKPFASKALKACYAQGAAAFGWERRKSEPRALREGNLLIGMGMATSTYPTNRMAASAMVRMLPDGTALVRCATQDLGTGTYTTMAQVAADELGLPLSRIKVELGDSRLPPAPVSGGSQTAASVLPAVQSAAAEVRAQILAMAIGQRDSAWHNLQPSDIRLEDGMLHGPTRSVSVSELMGRNASSSINAKADAAPEDADSHSPHAFGAQFAEVSVDRDLGVIKVRRWVGAFDCGRLINPKTARSQLLGGITFGIGMALLEETRTDKASGRLVNANIAEYLVPVNADIPDIEAIVVEGSDDVTTRLGLKGVGELPMVGAAAAVANAIYNATGVRVRDLPIRLEHMLA